MPQYPLRGTKRSQSTSFLANSGFLHGKKLHCFSRMGRIRKFGFSQVGEKPCSTTAMDGRETDARHETPLSAGDSVRGNVRGALHDLASVGLPDKAAPLTFYAALCVVAALTSLVALLGLIGSYPETSNAILEVIQRLRDTAGAGAFEGPVEDLLRDKQLAMLLFIGGLAATAGTTSLYLRAFRRVSRPLTGHQENPLPGRGPSHVFTLVVLTELIVLTGLCVIVSGSLAQTIGDVIGLSHEAVVSWDIVKWPLLIVMAFAGFASLQRSAFSDPRVLASSAATSSQVVATLAWVFAITGFALYLASFKTFENTYGTIGSAIVLLVWLTMFTMLYYVTPDLRISGITAVGAGAAFSTVTWLGVNAVLAVCVANLASLRGGLATILIGVAFLVALWISNLVVLLGVRLNALANLWPDTAPVSHSFAASRGRAEELVRVVGHALQNDVTHDGMLNPIADPDDATARMSDLELDLADWGFTYGVAWAAARAQDPREDDGSVADRALVAAREVFRLYCGQEGWDDHIRREISRRRPREDFVVERIEGAAGNGRGEYRLLR